jgi:excisionase family DNA binding protein
MPVGLWSMKIYREILNLNELQEYLRTRKVTAIELLKEGKIKAKKVGGEWRILKSEVDRYLSDYKR